MEFINFENKGIINFKACFAAYANLNILIIANLFKFFTHYNLNIHISLDLNLLEKNFIDSNIVY